ncbi:MAG: quinone-dependent dihydroorotate dehydrogenase, partial [Cyanobacteria bacterium Co-bin8]|nr:quinone-dependent dihydroorotate dehydrogenase [Cyanobacteria bacterium Co-bin8]
QRQNWLRHQLTVEDERLQQTLWGLTFANPLGLAAGFDKDGAAARAWPLFGFGFAELGTVTCHAQPGNPQPRLFRLTEDQAVLNRMGFNNQGATAMAAYLADLWPDGRSPIPIGINLGKSKITPLEEAAQDYLTSFKQLQPWGDYFVVNVSSPNTPGLRDLQATDQLAPILQALQQANTEQKPLLVKIAPDLEWDAIAAVVDLAQRYQLAGIIATNTTIRKDHLKTQLLPSTGRPLTEEAGGISGAPLRSRSTEVIRFIWKETQGQLPIVGVGGIFTAADAWEKLTAGASLLQTYTGWIYEGPWMVRRVLEGLLVQLEAHGLSSLQAAVGLADEI